MNERPAVLPCGAMAPLGRTVDFGDGVIDGGVLVPAKATVATSGPAVRPLRSFPWPRSDPAEVGPARLFPGVGVNGLSYPRRHLLAAGSECDDSRKVRQVGAPAAVLGALKDEKRGPLAADCDTGGYSAPSSSPTSQVLGGGQGGLYW